jgi:hypothetical protein
VSKKKLSKEVRVQPALSLKCLHIGRVLGRVVTSMDQVLEASRGGNVHETKTAVNSAVTRIESMAESFPMAKEHLDPVLSDLRKVQKKFPKTKAVGDVVMTHSARLGSLQAAATKTCSGS